MKALLTLLSILIVSFCEAQLAYDMSIKEACQFSYVTPGTYTCKPTIHKLGTVAILSLRINWQLDNGPIQSALINDFEVYTNLGGVDIYDRVVIPTPITFSSVGTHTLSVWCSDLNGNQADQNTSNDAQVKTIKVLPYLPPQHITLDYYTHTTCGPCGQQGGPKVKAVENQYPGVVDGLSIHFTNGTSDPYSNAHTATLNGGMNVVAHPELHIDRFKMPFLNDLDPSGSYTWMDTSRIAEDRLEYAEAIEVKYTQVDFDPATRLLEVTMEATFYDDVQAPMAFTSYVAEDSILGYQAGATNPNNYWHRNVFRQSMGSPFGDLGSVPSSVTNGQVVSYSFSSTLDPTWDLDMIRLYGAVVHVDAADHFKRRILNSQRITLNGGLALGNVEQQQLAIKVWPTITNEVINVKLDQSLGQYDALELVDPSGKLVAFIPSKGGQLIHQLDVSWMPAGLYMIRFRTDQGVVLERFVKQ